jgi:hypothetical protein
VVEKGIRKINSFPLLAFTATFSTLPASRSRRICRNFDKGRAVAIYFVSRPASCWICLLTQYAARTITISMGALRCGETEPRLYKLPMSHPPGKPLTEEPGGNNAQKLGCNMHKSGYPLLMKRVLTGFSAWQ